MLGEISLFSLAGAKKIEISKGNQVEYFLSPLDFLRFFLVFFLFSVAFSRFVFPLCFIFPPFQLQNLVRSYHRDVPWNPFGQDHRRESWRTVPPFVTK